MAITRLTMTDAAHKAGVPYHCMMRWVLRHNVAGHRDVTGHWFVDPRSLDAFLADHPEDVTAARIAGKGARAAHKAIGAILQRT